MALTKSKPANIFTPEGNSLALFIDVNDGVLKLKDVFGDVELFPTFKGGSLDGNVLSDFVPSIETDSVGITIDSTNQDTYCATVLEVTGAINVTIDDSVRDGFSISVIQMDANQCTFVASGGSLTLRNRQGNTQTSGQWATVTLFKNGNNLILAGDTA